MKRLMKWVVVLLGVLLSGYMLMAAATQEQKAASPSKVMYLTFDDGPSEYTNELLDLLAAHHMKATFFMLGPEMERYPEAVKRMIEEGHSVGVHGVSHERKLFYNGVFGPVKEMNEANDTLQAIAGQRTSLARTPYGSTPYLTKKQKEILENQNYLLWDWNIDSRDWSYRNPGRTFSYTLKSIKNTPKEPKVILFHDIKSVVETMTLFLDWMEDNHYVSKAITPDLQPVRLWHKEK